MRQSGRDPHTDRHGRVFTHISTPNVSNTIHGVYLTLDATGLLDDIPPALDLFGTKEVERSGSPSRTSKVDSVSDPKPTHPASSACLSRGCHRRAALRVASPSRATPSTRPTPLFVGRSTAQSCRWRGGPASAPLRRAVVAVVVVELEDVLGDVDLRGRRVGAAEGRLVVRDEAGAQDVRPAVHGPRDQGHLQ